MAAGKGGQLESIYQELIAKVNELAVNNEAKGVAEVDEIKALTDEHARLANPLGDDKIEIQRTKADGSTIIQERKLSDTMTAFERVLSHKRSELEQLLRELAEVDAEIATVKEDIAAIEKNEVAKLKRELDIQVAALKKQALKCKDATIAEVEKARKDEKKAADAQNQKFEEFMKSMF